jgi:hypothetical protein
MPRREIVTRVGMRLHQLRRRIATEPFLLLEPTSTSPDSKTSSRRSEPPIHPKVLPGVDPTEFLLSLALDLTFRIGASGVSRPIFLYWNPIPGTARLQKPDGPILNFDFADALAGQRAFPAPARHGLAVPVVSSPTFSQLHKARKWGYLPFAGHTPRTVKNPLSSRTQ